jgi:hypothetical protein
MSQTCYYRPILECLEERWVLAQATWTGAIDSNFWQPANWQGAVLPVAGDDVILTNGQHGAVFSTGSLNANTITGGPLAVTGGSLSASASGSALGSVTVTGGNLTLSGLSSIKSLTFLGGQVTVQGELLLNNLNWQAGTFFSQEGIVDLTGQGDVSGTGAKVLDGVSLVNEGTITFRGGPSVVVDALEVINEGTLDIGLSVLRADRYWQSFSEGSSAGTLRVTLVPNGSSGQVIAQEFAVLGGTLDLALSSTDQQGSTDYDIVVAGSVQGTFDSAPTSLGTISVSVTYNSQSVVVTLTATTTTTTTTTTTDPTVITTVPGGPGPGGTAGTGATLTGPLPGAPDNANVPGNSQGGAQRGQASPGGAFGQAPIGGPGFLARGVDGPAPGPGGPSGKRTSDLPSTIAMTDDELKKPQEVIALVGPLVLPSLELPPGEQLTAEDLIGSLVFGHQAHSRVLPQGGSAAAAVATVLDEGPPVIGGNAALADEALAGFLMSPEGHLGDWSGPETKGAISGQQAVPEEKGPDLWQVAAPVGLFTVAGAALLVAVWRSWRRS